MASGGAAIDSPRCVIGRQFRSEAEELLHKCFDERRRVRRRRPNIGAVGTATYSEVRSARDGEEFDVE